MKLNYQKLIRVSNFKLRVREKTTLLATDEFVAKNIMEAKELSQNNLIFLRSGLGQIWSI